MTQSHFLHRTNLRERGLSDRAIRGRVAHGSIRRIHRDVFHPYLQLGDLDLEQRWHAAALAYGPGSAISGVAGLQIRNRTRFRTRTADILSPNRRSLVIPETRFHTVASFSEDQIEYHGDVPLAIIERTIVDLGGELTPHQITNAIHQSLYHGPVCIDTVREILANSRRRSDVERAIELHLADSAGTRSFAEDGYLDLSDEIGAPEPLVGTVHVLAGSSYELDFYYPAHGLIVEIDGGAAHGRRYNRRADPARNDAAHASGLRIIRERGSSVFHDRLGCQRRLARALGL